jgi:hypothetical protein
VAIGKLALSLRAFQTQVIDDLAFGHVKAQAQLVVEFHGCTAEGK